MSKVCERAPSKHNELHLREVSIDNVHEATCERGHRVIIAWCGGVRTPFVRDDDCFSIVDLPPCPGLWTGEAVRLARAYHRHSDLCDSTRFFLPAEGGI